MSKVKIQGNASGTGVLTVTAPNTDTDRTITLPDADVTLGTDATKLPLAGGTMTGNISHASNLTLDVGGKLILDADDAGTVWIQDAGTIYGVLEKSSSDFVLRGGESDGDIVFKGNDGGSTITALTLDMSDAGKAIFNSGLAIGGTGAANTLDDYEEGTWTPQMDSDYSSVSYHGDNQGTYTKIGNVVIVNFRLHVTGWSGSSSGYATVCNLPFTVVTDGTFTAANPSWHFSLAEFPGTGYCNSNTTEIVWMRNHTGGDRIHLTGDDVFGSSGDARLCGSATYMTTA